MQNKNKNKTYSVAIRCRNCDINTSLFIPFGMTRSDFLKDIKCNRCGCYIIKIL